MYFGTSVTGSASSFFLPTILRELMDFTQSPIHEHPSLAFGFRTFDRERLCLRQSAATMAVLHSSSLLLGYWLRFAHCAGSCLSWRQTYGRILSHRRLLCRNRSVSDLDEQ